ncbi:MAG: hypothetical protein KGJ02_04615 [Verrucomicrobiota bacterium]|nr:hypothetical protein [Verrucomicrobiota bacterium]
MANNIASSKITMTVELGHSLSNESLYFRCEAENAAEDEATRVMDLFEDCSSQLQTALDRLEWEEITFQASKFDEDSVENICNGLYEYAWEALELKESQRVWKSAQLTDCDYIKKIAIDKKLSECEEARKEFKNKSGQLGIVFSYKKIELHASPPPKPKVKSDIQKNFRFAAYDKIRLYSPEDSPDKFIDPLVDTTTQLANLQLSKAVGQA